MKHLHTSSLILNTCTAYLVLYFVLWARLCSNVICIVISNFIFAAVSFSFMYLFQQFLFHNNNKSNRNNLAQGFFQQFFLLTMYLWFVAILRMRNHFENNALTKVVSAEEVKPHILNWTFSWHVSLITSWYLTVFQQ